MTALIVSGCGDSPSGGSNVKLAPAGGTVKFNGSPVANANVTFIPENGPVATATTDLSGNFKLTTGGSAGAAIGKCKVTVSAYEGGAKAASSEPVVANPTSEPSEATKKAMMGLGQQMQSASAAGSQGPKSLIPEIYSKPTSTTLTYTIDSDASKNQFNIDLKD